MRLYTLAFLDKIVSVALKFDTDKEILALVVINHKQHYYGANGQAGD